jgi:hypothetical protein
MKKPFNTYTLVATRITLTKVAEMMAGADDKEVGPFLAELIENLQQLREKKYPPLWEQAVNAVPDEMKKWSVNRWMGKVE